VLTDTACRKAAAKEKPYKLTDAQGLYLYVLPSGYKSWRWKYRVAGREKRMVFGPYPDVSLAEARTLRSDAAAVVRRGGDPAIDKKLRSAEQAAQAASTFELAARDWIASQRPSWSARYASIVERSFEADVFPEIGSMPLTAVTTPLVVKLLRPIERRGAVETAHRVRQRISEVYARAIAGGIATQDPAAAVRQALAKPRKGRFPAVRTIESAREVLTATEAQAGHPLTRLASRLLALTAVRSGAVRLIEWPELEGLDGAEPLWRVPAAKMKLLVDRKADVAFDFVVPLARQAVATIEAARPFSDGKGLIFRSVLSARRPISDSTLSKAYREAGFSGIHVPHGWRSTFSTIMNERALEDRPGDRAVIDLMLAHVPEGVEAAYNRAAYMPRRRAIAQEWADLLVEGLPPPAALTSGLRNSAPARESKRARSA
jgi:integrase